MTVEEWQAPVPTLPESDHASSSRALSFVESRNHRSQSCGVQPQTITSTCNESAPVPGSNEIEYFAQILVPDLKTKSAPVVTAWLCDCTGSACPMDACQIDEVPDACSSGPSTAECAPALAQYVSVVDGAVRVFCGYATAGLVDEKYPTVIVRIQ
jgi:hypothetical protein